jgi:hypothetical protein
MKRGVGNSPRHFKVRLEQMKITPNFAKQFWLCGGGGNLSETNAK